MVALAPGCGAGPGAPAPEQPSETARAVMAAEDMFSPAYSKSELQKALIAERLAVADADRVLGELEARPPGAAADAEIRIAGVDRAVRGRFLTALEACESSGRWCPPRLDDPAWTYEIDADEPADPPMTATLRFDLDSWRALAAELHGRACACRTIACVDSVGVAIDRLETRPVPQVRGDDVATTSITRARECLFRLRGKAAFRLTAPLAPAE